MTELKQLAEKYLSEHLPGHNQNLIDNKLYTMTISAMAGFAGSLVNRPLKPLSELHKDREACEAIWKKVHPDITLMNIQMWDDCTEMDGGEGSFTLTINSDTSKLINVIHELGYDVQPETKTT